MDAVPGFRTLSSGRGGIGHQEGAILMTVAHTSDHRFDDRYTQQDALPTGLFLDDLTREVLVDGRSVALTRVEFDLLAALYRNPRRVLTHAEILVAIWSSEWVGDEHAAEVYVSRVRKKLGESARQQRFIHTVHGVGYRYVPDAPRVVLPTCALFDETGVLVAILPAVDEILGWRVAEIIGTRFIPSKQSIFRSRRFITSVNKYAELIQLKGFTLRTCVRDRAGIDRDVDLEATFIYSQGRVQGLSVAYRWCD